LDVAVRALHLIAATVWAGGLVVLGIAAGVARRTVPEREGVGFFRALGRRFAILAMAATALLAATGADLASDELESWRRGSPLRRMRRSSRACVGRQSCPGSSLR
jgi:uncharacterized membrane protein